MASWDYDLDSVNPERRWRRGAGGPVPEEGRRLLAQGVEGGRVKLCRWAAAGSAVGKGLDQVHAEALLDALCQAGLVRVRERRDRRGAWEPYQWQLTPDGVALAPLEEAPVEVEPYLRGSDPSGHPVLQSIRTFLTVRSACRRPMALRLAMQIGRVIREGRIPVGRLLSVEIGGDTKAVDVTGYREELEEALGLPLEDVVRLHGRAVLLHGPLRFRIGAKEVDCTTLCPFTPLSPDTLESMIDLEVDASRLLMVENLVALEEAVRSGDQRDSLLVFTGGFPSQLEVRFLRRLLATGCIKSVEHWGDLDLGGLRILRYLQDTALAHPVRPYRMSAELLERLPPRALSERDRRGLRAWVEDRDAPGQALAEAMLRLDRKCEQEGWFLVPGLGLPPTQVLPGRLVGGEQAR